MNSTPATAKFFLHVEGQYSSEVWPIKARENPKLDERIKESYYGDEDSFSANFEISDMEDLLEILAFYAGAAVKITLTALVDATEFRTSAHVQPKWLGGIQGSFKAIERDDVSPETAANKMIALAHALLRFEAKNKATK